MTPEQPSQHDRDLAEYAVRQKTLRQLMIQRAQAPEDRKPELNRRIAALRTELDERHQALNHPTIEEPSDPDAS